MEVPGEVGQAHKANWHSQHRDISHNEAAVMSLFIASFYKKKTNSPKVIPVSVVSKTFCKGLTVESFI